jgi:hypothetical protein
VSVPFAVGEGSGVEVVLVGILAALAVLFVLAYVTRIPYPIWLTLGSGALAFVPGMPDVALSPDLVLLIVLPPLPASAAYFSSLRELRHHARPITLLVVATTVGVAAVAHWAIPGLSWEAAVVLGAVLGDRSGGGDGDRRADRRAPSHRHRARGGEPRQRRERADRRALRDRRGGHAPSRWSTRS